MADLKEKNNNCSAIIESLLSGMDTILSTKTVVGEPTKIGDTIIVPLVDVSFGAGAGASLNDNTKKNGGGGGITGKLSPNAVLIIKNGSTKLVNVKNSDALSKVLDMVPDVIDRIFGSKEDMPTDDEAINVAFGDNGTKEE